MNKRKHSGAARSRTRSDDDEPPELSRCPTPVDESAFPLLVSTLPLPTKSSSDYHETNSADPPSLTRSSPDDDSVLKEATKAGDGVASRAAEVKDVVADGRDFVMTRSSVRRVGSPDDTLDSVSSTESHLYGGGMNCDCMMPTLIADYDSSYGSACGRAAGAPTSDSEATTGSDHEVEKHDRMPVLKNCDVC